MLPIPRPHYLLAVATTIVLMAASPLVIKGLQRFSGFSFGGSSSSGVGAGVGGTGGILDNGSDNDMLPLSGGSVGGSGGAAAARVRIYSGHKEKSPARKRRYLDRDDGGFFGFGNGDIDSGVIGGRGGGVGVGAGGVSGGGGVEGGGGGTRRRAMLV